MATTLDARQTAERSGGAHEPELRIFECAGACFEVVVLSLQGLHELHVGAKLAFDFTEDQHQGWVGVRCVVSGVH